MLDIIDLKGKRVTGIKALGLNYFNRFYMTINRDEGALMLNPLLNQKVIVVRFRVDPLFPDPD